MADGAWVGFRVSILMPRKAWNAGPKPECKTNNMFIKLVLVMTNRNTEEPIIKHVISSVLGGFQLSAS